MAVDRATAVGLLRRRRSRRIGRCADDRVKHIPFSGVLEPALQQPAEASEKWRVGRQLRHGAGG